MKSLPPIRTATLRSQTVSGNLNQPMKNQSKVKSLILSVSFLAVFLIVFMLLSQIKGFVPEKFERYSHGVIGTIIALGAVWGFLKFEKKSLESIGLKWEKKTPKKFVLGLLVGFVLGSLMILSQVLYGGMEVSLSENYNIPSFILWSSALIPLAFLEEIAFRSYPFIKLNKVFGLRITQIIIAIFFALYHVLNGWSLVLAFLGPGIWALAFGLSAMFSNGISMPTGLHYGVNLVLALVSSQNGIEGIWTIDFPDNVSETVLKANENFGIGIQLALLVLCIIGTELYLRNKKTTAKTTPAHLNKKF